MIEHFAIFHNFELFPKYRRWEQTL